MTPDTGAARSPALPAWRRSLPVVALMFVTTLRNSSTVKLIESAMAPVTSSVTLAFTVRSPSARVPISLRPQNSFLVTLVFPFSSRLAHARFVQEEVGQGRTEQQ